MCCMCRHAWANRLHVGLRQILVPMEQGYMGRELDVVITGTGKFHMVGEVVRVVEHGVARHRPRPPANTQHAALRHTSHMWAGAAALLAILIAWRLAARLL